MLKAWPQLHKITLFSLFLHNFQWSCNSSASLCQHQAGKEEKGNASGYLKTTVFQVDIQNLLTLPCQTFTKSPNAGHLRPCHASLWTRVKEKQDLTETQPSLSNCTCTDARPENVNVNTMNHFFLAIVFLTIINTILYNQESCPLSFPPVLLCVPTTPVLLRWSCDLHWTHIRRESSLTQEFALYTFELWSRHVFVVHWENNC